MAEASLGTFRDWPVIRRDHHTLFRAWNVQITLRQIAAVPRQGETLLATFRL